VHGDSGAGYGGQVQETAKGHRGQLLSDCRRDGTRPGGLRSKDLDDTDRRVIGADIQVVEYIWPDVGKPLVAPLKDGVWEVRSALPSRRIARILLKQD
jgi:hypothetical protein